MTRARNSANLASHGNLFVDITNDRTGIGSVVPGQSLHVAGTAGFHGDVTFTGDLYNTTWDRSDNSLKFVDNAQIKLGTGNDAKLRHDGSNTWIQNATGYMYVDAQSSSGIRLISQSHWQAGAMAAFYPDSSVVLYHDASSKFSTEAYGTNTTGTAVNDGLVVAGVATVTTMNVTGVLTYDDVTSVDSVGIVTARQGIEIPNDTYKFRSGTSLEMQVWHDGTNSLIKDTRDSGKVRIQADNFDIIDKDASTTVFSAAPGGINSAKLHTFGAGIELDETIAHAGDTNTRIRFPSADRITLDTGGSEKVGVANTGVYVNDEFTISGTNGIPLRITGDLGTGDNVYIQNNTSGGHVQFGLRTNDTDGNHHRAFITAEKGSGASANGKLELLARGGNGINGGFIIDKGVGIQASLSIIPTANSTYDLGTSSLRWDEIYADAVDVTGSGTFDDINVGNNIVHVGDTDTSVDFTDNKISFKTGGTTRVSTGSTGTIFTDGVTISGNHQFIREGALGSYEQTTIWNQTSGGYIQIGYRQTDSDGPHHRGFLKASKGTGNVTGKFELLARGPGGGTNRGWIIDAGVGIQANLKVMPETDSTYDLGTSSVRWANVYADTLYGNGANITALNGSNIASGTIPVARIGTGTKNTSTFYRGDGTFATVTPPAITAINSASNNRVVTSDGGTTVTAESGLTYDGTTLQLAAADDIRIAGGAWTGEYTGGIKIQPDASNSYFQYHGGMYFRNAGGANRVYFDSAGNTTIVGNLTVNGGISGSGASITGVNATTLDSIDSGSFLRSDANDTATGTLTVRDILISAGYHLQRSDHHSGHLEGSYNNVGDNASKSNPIYTIGSAYNPTDAGLSNMYGIGYTHANASFIDSSITSNQAWGLYIAADGDARIFLSASSGNIWPTGVYGRLAHSKGHLQGTYNNIGDNSTKTNPIYTIGSSYNPADSTLSDMYGVGFSHTNASFISFTGASAWGFYVAADGDARVWLDGSNGVVSSTGQHYVGSNVVWNAGNDGSGSGLDADTLDGMQPSANASNSTIVQRNGNGYIFANYFNTTSNDTGTAADVTRFYCSEDNYIRYIDKASMRSVMNTSAVSGSFGGRETVTSDTNYWVGSMGWGNQNFDTTVWDYGSGFIDVWSNPSGQPSGTSHWQAIQAMHYTNQAGRYGFRIACGAGDPALLYVQGRWNVTTNGWHKLWNAANDGSGSGLDADTVDGIQASSFLRSDTDDSLTKGSLTTYSGGWNDWLVRFQNTNSTNDYVYMGHHNYGMHIRNDSSGTGHYLLDVYGSTGNRLQVRGSDARTTLTGTYLLQTGLIHFDVKLTSGTSSGDIKFNSVLENVGSHYSTSTGRFTAPVAGVYHFAGTVLQNNSGSQLDVNLRYNGSSGTKGNSMRATFTGHSTIQISETLKMNANDYVHINVSSGTLHHDSSGAWCGFQGTLLG